MGEIWAGQRVEEKEGGLNWGEASWEEISSHESQQVLTKQIVDRCEAAFREETSKEKGADENSYAEGKWKAYISSWNGSIEREKVHKAFKAKQDFIVRDKDLLENDQSSWRPSSPNDKSGNS